MTIKEIVHREYVDQERGFEYTMMPLEDTIQVKETPEGFTVGYLVQDQDLESPDSWGDNSLFLVHYHNDFWIKDDRATKDVLRAWYLGDESEELDELEKEYWIFAVAAYIHSGVVLSLGSGRHFPDYRWDVSHVGAVFASKKEWPEETKAHEAAGSLIETWNQYLSGEVFGIVVEKFTKGKELIDYDSVWGFYGLEHAQESLAEQMEEPHE